MAFDKAKFKKKMRTNGFTQKNIAEVLNVDIRTVSRWLDPKISLSSEKIATLCDVIGEAPSDFDPNGKEISAIQIKQEFQQKYQVHQRMVIG